MPSELAAVRQSINAIKIQLNISRKHNEFRYLRNHIRKGLYPYSLRNGYDITCNRSNTRNDMIYKWLGTVSFLLAALLLSSNIESSKYGFLVFLYGHTILSYYFWFKNKDLPMFIQNFFFIGVDLWGIYRWFF